MVVLNCLGLYLSLEFFLQSLDVEEKAVVRGEYGSSS